MPRRDSFQPRNDYPSNLFPKDNCVILLCIRQHVSLFNEEIDKMQSDTESKSLYVRQWPHQRLSVLKPILAWQPSLYPSLFFSCQREENLPLDPISAATNQIYSLSPSLKDEKPGRGHTHARKPDLPQRAHITVYSACVNHILAARVRVNTFRTSVHKKIIPTALVHTLNSKNCILFASFTQEQKSSKFCAAFMDPQIFFFSSIKTKQCLPLLTVKRCS